MSMASPTLRSSWTTAPWASLSSSLTSMRARPSTAETLTGTSNTASRSAAARAAGSARSGSSASSATWLRSRSGKGMRSVPMGLVPAGQIGGHGRVDAPLQGGAVADEAAVRPFHAAVAGRDVGLAENHEAALEAALARELVEDRLQAAGVLGPEPHH